MAATAEALVHDRRSARPHLRVAAGNDARLARRRVTARRRRAVLAVVAAAAFAAGVLAASVGESGLPGRAGSAGAGQGPHPAPSAGETVVVAPGDTVWDLAQEHRPEGMRAREYVTAILERNDMEPTALRPGTVVRLPSP